MQATKERRVKKPKKCIVIGAGLAGLAAAYRPKPHQFHVTF